MYLLWGIANSHHDPVHNPTLARQVVVRCAKAQTLIDRFPAIACDPPHLPCFTVCQNLILSKLYFYFMVYSMRSKRGALCAQGSGKLSVAAARQAQDGSVRTRAPGTNTVRRTGSERPDTTFPRGLTVCDGSRGRVSSRGRKEVWHCGSFM